MSECKAQKAYLITIVFKILFPFHLEILQNVHQFRRKMVLAIICLLIEKVRFYKKFIEKKNPFGEGGNIYKYTWVI